MAYYYLVESARVNGQPRIISQEYLGTAGELAAAMRGEGLGLPARTQHKDSARPQPPGGCWMIWAWPPSSTR
jgi:hypothetical protein